MPKKKTEVLCTIPLPMPMDRAVEVLKGLDKAFSGQTYLRNGNACWEVIRYVDEKEPDAKVDTLPKMREAAGSVISTTQLPKEKDKT